MQRKLDHAHIILEALITEDYEALEESAAIYRATVGDRHSQLATTLHNLALARMADGDREGAWQEHALLAAIDPEAGAALAEMLERRGPR